MLGAVSGNSPWASWSCQQQECPIPEVPSQRSHPKCPIPLGILQSIASGSVGLGVFPIFRIMLQAVSGNSPWASWRCQQQECPIPKVPSQLEISQSQLEISQSSTSGSAGLGVFPCSGPQDASPLSWLCFEEEEQDGMNDLCGFVGAALEGLFQRN